MDVYIFLILFDFLVSLWTHAVLFRVCNAIFLLGNLHTILHPWKVLKAIYDVEPRHDLPLELVFVNSERGHLVALHVLDIGRSIITFDFLLHFLQIDVTKVIVHLHINLVEMQWWTLRVALDLYLLLL